MKDSFTHENRRDFAQRYRGCYAWYTPPDKEKQLVIIQEVEDNYVYFQGKAGINFSARIDSGIEWEFTQVERGWRQGGDKAYYFYRVPQRQFSRGISANNTGVLVLTEKEHYVGDLSFDTMLKCFTQDKTTADVAVLSKHFAVNKSTLFLYDRAVGSRKDNQLLLTSPIFRQELVDVIKRNNLSFEVK